MFKIFSVVKVKFESRSILGRVHFRYISFMCKLYTKCKYFSIQSTMGLVNFQHKTFIGNLKQLIRIRLMDNMEFLKYSMHKLIAFSGVDLITPLRVLAFSSK